MNIQAFPDTTVTVELVANWKSESRAVDLSGLSPLAAFLARYVVTTVNADDFSTVFLRDGLTLQERAVALGKPYTENELTAFPRLRTRRSALRWRWDGLRRDETSEAYFERAAREMLAVTGTTEIVVPVAKSLPSSRCVFDTRLATSRIEVA